MNILSFSTLHGMGKLPQPPDLTTNRICKTLCEFGMFVASPTEQRTELNHKLTGVAGWMSMFFGHDKCVGTCSGHLGGIWDSPGHFWLLRGHLSTDLADIPNLDGAPGDFFPLVPVLFCGHFLTN